MAGRPAEIKLGWNKQKEKYGFYYIRPPAPFIEFVVGWKKDHKLKLEYDYNKDIIIIENIDKRHKKKGFLEHSLGIREAQKKQLGNKKYKELILKSLTPDGRKVLAQTDWKKVKPTYDPLLLKEFYEDYVKFLDKQKERNIFKNDLFIQSLVETLRSNSTKTITYMEGKSSKKN
jgi:hypothetical protein